MAPKSKRPAKDMPRKGGMKDKPMMKGDMPMKKPMKGKGH